MNKPVLVIMAAGMGSRYGGLKQIEPIDDKGHMIIDFSIYDAIKAGFEKIYFIIMKENEAVFRKIGNKVFPMCRLNMYQDLNDLPRVLVCQPKELSLGVLAMQCCHVWTSWKALCGNKCR